MGFFRAIMQGFAGAMGCLGFIILLAVGILAGLAFLGSRTSDQSIDAQARAQKIIEGKIMADKLGIPSPHQTTAPPQRKPVPQN